MSKVSTFPRGLPLRQNDAVYILHDNEDGTYESVQANLGEVRTMGRPGQLRRWRTALGKYRAGLGNARILFAGDRIIRGYGASTTGTLQAQNAMHAAVSKQLVKLGERSSYSGFLGNGNLDQSQFDGRISQGSWGINDGRGYYRIGGEMFYASDAATFTFTPDQNTNQCDIWYGTYPDGGIFNKQANSVTATAVNTSASPGGLLKTTLTAASLNSTNIYKAIWSSGTRFLVGFECYDNTSTRINCINAGWFGSECDWWTQTGQGDPNPWDPNQSWSAFDADLVVFDCGGNDLHDGKTLSYMTTEYQKIITNVLAAGSDMILTISAAPDPSWLSEADMLEYAGAIYDLAAANNLPVVDCYRSWGRDYSYMNSLGMYRRGDTVHLSPAGYSDFGNQLTQVIYNC